MVTRVKLKPCIPASSATRGGSTRCAHRLSQRRSAARSFASSSTAPVARNTPSLREEILTVADRCARYSIVQFSLTAGSVICVGRCQGSSTSSALPNCLSRASIQLRCSRMSPGTSRSSKPRGTTTTSPSTGLMVRFTCRARDERRTRYLGSIILAPIPASGPNASCIPVYCVTEAGQYTSVCF